MIKKIFAYLFIVILYLININNLYKTLQHIKKNQIPKRGTLINKIFTLLLLITCSIYNKKFIEITFIIKIIITLISTMINLIEISQSPPVLKFLIILKHKPSPLALIFFLIVIILFVFFINYFFLSLLKNLFLAISYYI